MVALVLVRAAVLQLDNLLVVQRQLKHFALVVGKIQQFSIEKNSDCRMERK